MPQAWWQSQISSACNKRGPAFSSEKENIQIQLQILLLLTNTTTHLEWCMCLCVRGTDSVADSSHIRDLSFHGSGHAG